MNDCIFCKIANGEIPTNTVYEDELFRAILDANPANTGHTLIIPKTHATNVFEIDETTVGKAYMLAKKLSLAVKEATGCEGINILQNNGEAAGQTVNHFHIHVVPRNKKDDVNIGFGSAVNISSEETEAVRKKIADNIK